MLSDRDSARHRSTQRPVTVLSDVGDAVTGTLSVVGRSGAIIAASTGLIASVGLPASAYGGQDSTITLTQPVTSTDASARTTLAVTSAGLLSAMPRPMSGIPLTAPMSATVVFEPNSFTPVPATPIAPAAPRHALPRAGTAPAH